MLLFLLQFFKNILHWKIPAVFLYSSTRMIIAASFSLLFTIFFGPKFIQKLYELRIGQKIRGKEECPLLAELHGKKKNTPTMGGVLILSSMLFSLLFFMDFTSSFTWILLFSTLFLGALGGVDDYLKLKKKNTKGLSARKKMIMQGVFCILLSSYLLFPFITDFFSSVMHLQAPVAKETMGEFMLLSTREYMQVFFFPFFKEPISFLPISCIFIWIFFVVTGSSNAVNLTDGLDGLAAGCLVMVATVLGIVAFLSNNISIASYLNILYIEKGSEIGVYLFAMAGACLGFLWYNGYPAQIFMGDTGSLALGGILGVASVLLRRELLLALVGAIFVVETLSVILQVASYRLRNKKRIFLCAPLHHHYEYKGWPETKVVLRFWIVTLLLALIGLASLKFQ